MPISSDPEQRAKQIANLQRGRKAKPPEPPPKVPTAAEWEAKLNARLPEGERRRDEKDAMRFIAMGEVNLAEQLELVKRPHLSVEKAWARRTEINKWVMDRLPAMYAALEAATAARMKEQQAAKPVMPSRDPERGAKVVRLLLKQAAVRGVSPRVTKLARELSMAMDEDAKQKAAAQLEEAATAKEGGDG